jgi:hypothetical protein
MKTFSICLIIAFCSLIGTIFVMETHSFLMSSLPVSLIAAFCSVIGAIFIIENLSVIKKAFPFSVKEVTTMAIIAMIGTILTIVVVNNLGVLQ